MRMRGIRRAKILFRPPVGSFIPQAMRILPSLCALACLSMPLLAAEKQWVQYEGRSGPGKSKHIVFLSGDEEYRSEQGLVQLARILSDRHGFTTTVLFSINKETGEIDPNTKDNEPGIEALDHADLCVMQLRFRAWPDEQMKHFADYVAAGKPLIGLRTSTHAFSGIKGAYSRFNTFGKDIFGEGWVSHWGKHKSEATRGVIEPPAKDDPLLRAVVEVFGTTDVYEAHPPADAKILLRGQVVAGMNPKDPPAEYKKPRATDKEEQPVNQPMMPIAWTREVRNSGGRTNRILCTTMGAATDLQNEGLRRLIVNAAYAFTGLEVPARADVRVVGEYAPLPYGFGGFKKGVKPADVQH